MESSGYIQLAELKEGVLSIVKVNLTRERKAPEHWIVEQMYRPRAELKELFTIPIDKRSFFTSESLRESLRVYAAAKNLLERKKFGVGNIPGATSGIGEQEKCWTVLMVEGGIGGLI